MNEKRGDSGSDQRNTLVVIVDTDSLYRLIMVDSGSDQRNILVVIFDTDSLYQLIMVATVKLSK